MKQRRRLPRVRAVVATALAIGIAVAGLAMLELQRYVAEIDDEERLDQKRSQG